MAPEIALDKIEALTHAGDTVLDPMCGSGTVVRVAVSEGRTAIGADLDPLAVFITRTISRQGWLTGLEDQALEVVKRAQRLGDALPSWIARDSATKEFVSYWFAQPQVVQLSKLARVLKGEPLKSDPLRVALSRTIITKEGGASLARDTSHSRPHRVRASNDFDVFAGFIGAARRIEALTHPELNTAKARVRRSDARSLSFLEDASVDLVVTSPPYLNAIDYLRGHRMSLVWLGWTVSELRKIRGESVGAERGLDSLDDEEREIIGTANLRASELGERQERMVWRFVHDMNRLCRSLSRVTKPGGHLVFVVADSQLRGVPVLNSQICVAAAASQGFRLLDTQTRELPGRHRYLPPPGRSRGTLALRMKEEIVYTFRKP
jgi:SAM-dependent methyltransferase